MRLVTDLIEPSDSPGLVETADQLVPVLYDDLHRIARRERVKGAMCQTLQTTALVHEAYLKMRDMPGFNDQGHFLRASALAMRHILVDRARRRLAEKHSGGAAMITLDEDLGLAAATDDAALVELNETLLRLAQLNLRLARVVELRFFAGYGEQEAAMALGVTDRTVRRDWIKARAWLLRELDDGNRDA